MRIRANLLFCNPILRRKVVKGTMAFDRKEFGMNSGIPFIKIADRVEVDVALQAHQVSGPRLVFKE
jgi:hypothetical protein